MQSEVCVHCLASLAVFGADDVPSPAGSPEWIYTRAYTKARGMGLSIPLSDIAFRFGGNGHLTTTFAQSFADTPSLLEPWQCERLFTYGRCGRRRTSPEHPHLRGCAGRPLARILGEYSLALWRFVMLWEHGPRASKWFKACEFPHQREQGANSISGVSSQLLTEPAVMPAKK